MTHELPVWINEQIRSMCSRELVSSRAKIVSNCDINHEHVREISENIEQCRILRDICLYLYSSYRESGCVCSNLPPEDCFEKICSSVWRLIKLKDYKPNSIDLKSPRVALRNLLKPPHNTELYGDYANILRRLEETGLVTLENVAQCVEDIDGSVICVKLPGTQSSYLKTLYSALAGPNLDASRIIRQLPYSVYVFANLYGLNCIYELYELYIVYLKHVGIAKCSLDEFLGNFIELMRVNAFYDEVARIKDVGGTIGDIEEYMEESCFARITGYIYNVNEKLFKEIKHISKKMKNNKCRTKLGYNDVENTLRKYLKRKELATLAKLTASIAACMASEPCRIDFLKKTEEITGSSELLKLIEDTRRAMEQYGRYVGEETAHLPSFNKIVLSC